MTQDTTRTQRFCDQLRIALRPFMFPYRTANYTGKRILLDAGHYNGCTFTDCTIVLYGKHCNLHNCVFKGCLFEFTGNAGNALYILKLMYQQFGGDGVKDQIERLISGESNEVWGDQ